MFVVRHIKAPQPGGIISSSGVTTGTDNSKLQSGKCLFGRFLLHLLTVTGFHLWLTTTSCLLLKIEKLRWFIICIFEAFTWKSAEAPLQLKERRHQARSVPLKSQSQISDYRGILASRQATSLCISGDKPRLPVSLVFFYKRHQPSPDSPFRFYR